MIQPGAEIGLQIEVRNMTKKVVIENQDRTGMG